MRSWHHFHIPVMGTGFTIDTPLWVAPFGISSVVSLVDDQLIEQMYQHHARAAGVPVKEIRRNEPDARARRITRYLNLLEDLIAVRFSEMKQQDFTPGSSLYRYFELLPSDSPLYHCFQSMLAEGDPAARVAAQQTLREKMTIGSIDVNIMTKLDRPQYKDGAVVTSELSDALAALKGYAESTLCSAIVFSAGVNAKLFQALSEYDDFFPTEDQSARKRVVLKVSDFRSALTQGKMLAKRGIWVSEFRVESGLNCGGHAFPTKGEVMAVVLDEFRSRREELVGTLFKLYARAIQARLGSAPVEPPEMLFSAQGGVGTPEEHHFLRQHFELDSVGWGTPFLLVPEATTVDDETRQKLALANSADVVLSDSSPLGVPFYTLRDSASEQSRRQKISAGSPGSPCFNKHLALNTEFGGEPLCVASQSYQKKKLAEIEASELSKDEREQQRAAVLGKACICFDLGAAPRLSGGSEVHERMLSPAVCPGPNIAYFQSCYSLQEMVDHIYGRDSKVKLKSDRPHVLLKEFGLYVDYIVQQFTGSDKNSGQSKQLQVFRENLELGLDRYRELAQVVANGCDDVCQRFVATCDAMRSTLQTLAMRDACNSRT